MQEPIPKKHTVFFYIYMAGQISDWFSSYIKRKSITSFFSKQIMILRSGVTSANLENTLMLQIFWGQGIQRTHESQERLIFSVGLQNCPDNLFFIPFNLLNIFSVGDLLVWFISNNHKQKYGKK